jgi:hypothetical protein
MHSVYAANLMLQHWSLFICLFVFLKLDTFHVHFSDFSFVHIGDAI